jgi:hypothetical protein
MKNLDPKIKEFIETVKKLIYEIENQTPGQQHKPSIDFNAFDVTGYAGQEYGGFPEPIIKMEDEF